MKKLSLTVCAMMLSTGVCSLYAASLSEEPINKDTVPESTEIAIALIDTATTSTENFVAIADEPAKDENGDKKDEGDKKEETTKDEGSLLLAIAEEPAKDESGDKKDEGDKKEETTKDEGALLLAVADEPAKDENGDKKDEPSKDEPSSEENVLA